MKRALTLLPIGLSLGALALAGCGSDDSVSIENAWGRTSAVGQTTGAVYFEITVDEDDTLVGASVPASIAAEAQIHEVVMADMDSGDMDSSDMDSDEMDDMGDMEGSDDMDDMESGGMDMGAMRMQELPDGLDLKAGETVTLKPGSYHVMLLDIAEPLEVGDEIEVTLEFAKADSMTINVEVAESAP
jgi:copper(I)-binding protein